MRRETFEMLENLFENMVLDSTESKKKFLEINRLHKKEYGGSDMMESYRKYKSFKR